MLQRSRSKTTAKLKYLFIVPLMLVMLITVSFSENSMDRYPDACEVKNEIQPESQIPISDQENMPFAIVDQVPEYPGCDQEDYESRKECLISSIRDHVNRNFNTGKVKPYTAKGINRIMVVFEINSNGDVTGVKSRMVTSGPDPEAKAVIQEEANRVVASLPKMKPGKHNGKEIGVTYALPIEIMVPVEEEKK